MGIIGRLHDRMTKKEVLNHNYQLKELSRRGSEEMTASQREKAATAGVLLLLGLSLQRGTEEIPLLSYVDAFTRSSLSGRYQ